LKLKCFHQKTIKAAFVLVFFASFSAFISSCGTSSGGPAVQYDYFIGDYQIPWGMVLNEDGSRLYVANSVANTITEIDTSSMNVLRTVDVICRPRNLAFNPSYTKLYITHDNQSNDDECSTSEYLPSEVRRSEAWMSVVDIDEMEVTNEVELKYDGIDPSSPRDIEYDSINNLIYVTATKNYRIVIVDPQTETTIKHLTIFSGLKPINIEVSKSENIAYALDTDGYIYPFTLADADTTDIERVTYNPQLEGYCASANNPNGCACGSNSNCNSGSCGGGGQLTYCVEKCTKSSPNIENGCACGSDTDCSSGICVDGYCEANSSLGLQSFRGFCDPDSGSCTEYDIGSCFVPWDMALVNDDTIYVSCKGDDEEKDEKQPILKVIVDDDGLANSNKAVAYEIGEEICRQPTALATDPSREYVFAVCYRKNRLLTFIADTGEEISNIEIPQNAIDIVASNDYVFVSSSTENKIIKYAFPKQ